MDIKCYNIVEEKRNSLKELIEKYVHNPEKYRELENIEYSIKQIELNPDYIEFEKLHYIAEELCIGVLIDAVAILNSRNNVKYFVDIKEDYYLNDSSNILRWPTMKEFDLNKFRSLISSFISKWKLSPGIKYCIQYQSSHTVNVSNFHDFLVIFSIPTKSCPNPQVVAYANFTVETCACVPNSVPVFVSYKFEQYFKTHVANSDLDFQDMLIKLILISKSRFYESLN